MAKKQSNPKNDAPKAQPVEEIRIGAIKAAIWRNDGENGDRQPQVRFNVTLQRIYRTEDGQWHSTASFGRDDLLVLMKVADAAHTRVLQLIGEQREQQRFHERQEQPAV